MNKIIIHVGQYKTGSTSIQKMMWGARYDLLDHGILYPQSFVRDAAHFLITDGLRNSFRNTSVQTDLEPLREEIEASSAEVAVISCEALSGATVRRFAPEMMLYMWRRLAELFDGFDVRVLFYTRRQDESINSRIIQEIKGQSRKSMIDYEAFLYANSSLNFHYFFGLLEQVFGKGKVDSRLYDRNYLYHTDVRYDFLNYLGLSNDSLAVTGDEDNVSPSSRLIALYRVLNAMGLDVSTYSAINHGLWEEFNVAGGGDKAVVLGKLERQRVMEFYRVDNERFVEECVRAEEKQAYSDVLFREENDVSSNVLVDGVEVMRLLKRKGYWLVKTG